MSEMENTKIKNGMDGLNSKMTQVRKELVSL